MFLPEKLNRFRADVWQFYNQFRRSFAWRDAITPYHVFISEVMLQQTQTYRVEPKFTQFIAAFPDFKSLASATLADVLAQWQGLGYNRRAKFLHQSAQIIMERFNGQLPDEPEILQKLPGIGYATASSIAAFAFNKPTVFIETNIRTVFIHSFFSTEDQVSDKEILPLIESTVDRSNPREWYYALMDYGVYLKKKFPNPSRKSKHYTRQSTFKGSRRQIRGAILKLLLETRILPQQDLINMINDPEERTESVIKDLLSEQMIQSQGGNLILV